MALQNMVRTLLGHMQRWEHLPEVGRLGTSIPMNAGQRLDKETFAFPTPTFSWEKCCPNHTKILLSPCQLRLNFPHFGWKALPGGREVAFRRSHSPRPLRPAIHRSHQVWPSCMHDVSSNVCVRGFKLQICVTKEFPILLHVFPCLYRSPPFFLLAVKQHKETLCMLLILKQHSFSNIQG